MPTKIKTDALTMEQLVKLQGDNLIPFSVGQVVEGIVVRASHNRIWLDVCGLMLGIVPECELSVFSESLKVGDKVSAYILEIEDEKGNMILSLKRADQERLTDDLRKKYQEGQVLDIKISEANKGGLLVEIGDYQGFLPVSQLASKHYPRVEGGDPDKIYSKLKDLIGTVIQAKIISFDANQGKLIFSEKAAGDEDQEKKLANIKEGGVLEGIVTGIVDFGIFVKVGEGESELEGLVHISEIAWGRVTDLRSMFKIGDKVKVLIVSTEDNRVSLSIKRLQSDPWRTAASKYKIGDQVKGKITKITDYGLFVRIGSEIDGLVHLSEIDGKDKALPTEKYRTDKDYSFKIISFDPDAHRLGLSLKLDDEPVEKQTTAEKKTKTVDKPAEKKKTATVAKKTKETKKETGDKNSKKKKSPIKAKKA